ncbi:hypothetical protein ACWCQL_13230 [Streptomyces sp. NPDC002073]
MTTPGPGPDGPEPGRTRLQRVKDVVQLAASGLQAAYYALRVVRDLLL